MTKRVVHQFVSELPKKLDCLFEVATIRGVEWLASQKRLAETLNIQPSVLSRVRNEYEPTYSRLSQKLQAQIADAFGFDASWPEWRDVEADIDEAKDRRDSAAAFEARYKLEGGLLRGSWPSNSGDPIGFSLAVTQSQEFLSHAFSADVSFVRDVEQRSDALAMHGSISFGAHPLEEVGDLCIRRGTLRLRANGFEVVAGSKLGRDGVLKFCDGGVELRALGAKDKPAWTLEAANADGLFGAISVEGPPFCVLADFGSGDDVEVVLTVFPRDVSLTEMNEAAAIVYAGEEAADAALGADARSNLIRKVVANFVAQHLPRQGDECVLGSYRYERRQR